MPALGRLNWLGRVVALLALFSALPVRYLRGMNLGSQQVFSLSPCERAAMLTENGGTRRQIRRQVRRIKQVPRKRYPQVQAVIVPEISPKRPAVLPKEIREA